MEKEIFMINMHEKKSEKLHFFIGRTFFSNLNFGFIPFIKNKFYLLVAYFCPQFDEKQADKK